MASGDSGVEMGSESGAPATGSGSGSGEEGFPHEVFGFHTGM